MPLKIDRPLVRKILAIAAGVLVLWAIAGFLILPKVLRPIAERRLSESLHRPVTLKKLSINPFTLSATAEGLDVKEKGGAGPFLSFERLYVNVEAISLLRGAPIVRAVTLTRPSVSLVRNPDGTYNVSDILDEMARPRPPKEKPFLFSVNNIRVEGGAVDFDDRPRGRKHTVRDVEIGLPFLSNMPSRVEITTAPAFQARVNGALFAVKGSSKPFSQTHETNVNLNIADVDLPYYLAYLPSPTAVKFGSGRLDAALTLAFTQPPKGNPRLVLSGTAALRKLAAEIRGAPLLTCERFEAALASFDVFGRKARVASLIAMQPELWVRRAKGGGFEIASGVLPAGPSPKTGPPPRRGGAPDPPFLVEVSEVDVRGGRVHYEDSSLPRPFRTILQDISVDLEGLSTAPGKTAKLRVLAKSEAGETLKNTGTVSIEPPVLEGEFEATGLPLKRYQPFLDSFFRFDVDDGVLDFKTKYRYSTGANAVTRVEGLSADLKSARLTRRGEKEPFFRAPAVRLAGTGVDLGKREAVVGELSSVQGVLAVARAKDGSVDLAKLLAEPAAGSAPAPPSAPWNVTLGKLALDGYTIKVDDREPRLPAHYRLTSVNLALEKLSTARGSKGSLAVRFGVDGKGLASAKGPVGFDPIFADLEARVKGLPLVPIQAYIVQDFNVTLARGTLTAAGNLHFGEGAGSKASFTYKGAALVGGFLVLDRATNLEFLKWESFSAEGMKAGYNPMFLEISRLALAGIACDWTIEPDGSTSLQRVVGAPPSPPDDEAGTEEAPAAAPAAAPEPVPNPAPAASEKVPIKIDTLIVQAGRIGFADRFIQPSYSATLSDLAGRVTGLDSREGTVAQVDVRGTLANHSPLQITGSVNPLSAARFADVKASFRDIDLPPFTGYSGKYAGYGIARGVLTMEVAYKLQNRKLAAQNRFLVDQFDFGEKVESKTATKLPVRLAVSLLKDKDGLIDLDLPIEGSLDDPKFRLGKVIWKVLGNLIGKAVTAPFSLLGKLLGGGGQEFSSVEFADGRETPDEAARKKLDALAKALVNRPALKLEAIGRTSGDKDREGLKRLRLQRKVKAQKLADLAKKGEAPAGVDDVVVEEKEYETWLAKAYKKEKFPKPRNFLGIAKDLPASEMENLMLSNLAATDDDLRQLALARANSVKDYLVTAGKVDASRVFVLEPGAKPAAPADKGAASRVDFSLK